MKITLKKIEEAYNSLLNKYLSRKHQEKKYTECEKIEMVMRNSNQIWWFAYELIGEFSVNGENLFIGYKAPARLHDLEVRGIVVSRWLGKYKVWRLL